MGIKIQIFKHLVRIHGKVPRSSSALSEADIGDHGSPLHFVICSMHEDVIDALVCDTC